MSSPWMATKYAILQQNADTASAAQQSQAGLQQAQGGLIGQQAQGAGIQNQFLPDVLKGEIGFNQARTRHTNSQAQTLDLDNAPAGGGVIGRTAAQIAAANRAKFGIMGMPSGAPTVGEVAPLGGLGAPMMSDTRVRELNPGMVQGGRGWYYSDPSEPRGFKKGIARVPGKGDGTKDTVPAKLAPGEAVMNKAAADHMGRGLIAVLNKLGAEKMGLV